MSEERFDRLEVLIGQIGGRIGGLENRMGSLEDRMGSLEDRMGGVEGRVGGLEGRFNQLAQNQDALREDIVELRHRIDSIEGTVRIAIADGFRNHDSYLDDLNIDLAANERQTRRLNRRVARLEGA
jgi:chromosome segregation ATPase